MFRIPGFRVAACVPMFIQATQHNIGWNAHKHFTMIQF